MQLVLVREYEIKTLKLLTVQQTTYESVKK